MLHVPKRRKLDPSLISPEMYEMERRLKRMVVGQDHSIQEIVETYQMYLSGLAAPNKPLGSFLMLGPTGTGKTRTVEVLAESILGNPKALIKVNCAEFQHSHETAKLMGSPPGYLGHRETHPILSQENLNQYHTEKHKISFVLFDEIEKANDALWDLLLGILDKGTFKLGDNRQVDFSRAMIFLTSNLGADEIQKILVPNMGFTTAIDVQVDTKIENKLDAAGLQAARKRFKPEFINRLDKILHYHPLSKENMKQILEIELNFVQQRVFGIIEKTFVISFSDAAKEFLLYNPDDKDAIKYGARFLKRKIEKEVVQPLAMLINSGQIHKGNDVRVYKQTKANHLTFTVENEAVFT